MMVSLLHARPPVVDLKGGGVRSDGVLAVNRKSLFTREARRKRLHDIST